jgi:hypothetical protein
LLRGYLICRELHYAQGGSGGRGVYWPKAILTTWLGRGESRTTIQPRGSGPGG